MNTENISIEYRPLRIGFCVRYDDVQDVVTAARLTTLLWGGMHNPIIPVGAPGSLADHLVRLFQVDILVPIADTSEIKAFTERYGWARFPREYHSDTILTEDSHDRTRKIVRVLDVSHLIQKYWNEEFRFARDGTSNCAMVTWKSSDPHANVLNLMFGGYPKEKLSYQYEKNFKKALRAQEVKIDGRKPIPALLARRTTPIGLTEQDIKSYAGGRRNTGFYVGDPGNFSDLVNFWNIRAADAYLTFLPKENAGRFLNFVRAHTDRIAKANEFGGNEVLVSVWFAGDGQRTHEEMVAITKPFEAKDRGFIMHGVDVHSWNGLNINPSSSILSETSSMANVGIKYGKPTITAQLSDKPFPKRERRYLDQYFVVSLKPFVSVEFPDHTLTLPVLPDLNEWYARQMVFDDYSVRCVKTWFGRTVSVITDIDQDVVDVSPIRKYELIKKIFERAAVAAEKSGAGLVAERLIALMGGINGAARIFKITGVRKFIENTDPLQQQAKFEIEKKIDDGGSFTKFVKQFGLGGGPLTTEQVFKTMIQRNLLQAGMEVRCPKCSLKTWINLRDVDEMYACEFCQEKSRFVDVVQPITIKAQNEVKTIDGTRWHYRLTGLVGKRDKQQGAIPVILTLQHLTNRLRHILGDNLYSTALNLAYEKNGARESAETDLTFFDLGRRNGTDNIEVLIGECKTGQLITRAQIDRLIEVRKLIEKSGVKCHLVFVKTKGEFSAAEIGHFKRLMSMGINPILFTAIELERWWDEYAGFKAKRADFKLPVEHPFTFRELAANSSYVYQLQ
jgi:hypothetical protein